MSRSSESTISPNEDASTNLMRRLQSSLKGDADREHYARLLVERYYGRLSALIGRRIADPEDVKEVVYLILAKVLISVDRFDRTKAKPFTWIFQIARNSIADFFRARKRSHETIDFSQFDLPDARDELASFFAWDIWKTAREKVQSLSRADHWACYERCIEGKEDLESVAKDLKMAVSSCKSYRDRIGLAIIVEFRKLNTEEGTNP